ncbi:MAG: hypothetical protein AMK70_14345 [Nitrospira bacterium SG8_35_1]|nr:MAG: hypothetical protein AMK70_14345 [Nitrospira bacterium SG8_35_1]
MLKKEEKKDRAEQAPEQDHLTCQKPAAGWKMTVAEYTACIARRKGKAAAAAIRPSARWLGLLNISNKKFKFTLLIPQARELCPL